MKTLLLRSLMAGLSLAFLLTVGRCATADYGDGGAAYGVDYYEPSGYVYGQWHEGYRVAPPRGHEEHREARPEHREAAKPAYRPAPANRPAPSIPSRSRSRDHH